LFFENLDGTLNAYTQIIGSNPIVPTILADCGHGHWPNESPSVLAGHFMGTWRNWWRTIILR